MTDTTDTRARRMQHALAIAGTLTEHVLAQRGTQGSSSGPRVQTTKEPPAPLNVQAVDDADSVYRSLTDWSTVVGERTGDTPPRPLVGSRRLADGAIDGLPSDLDPTLAGAVVRRLASWLLERLALVPDLHEPMQIDTDAILKLRGRWPMEDSSTRAGIPCPHHEGRVGISIYPPTQHPDREGAAVDGALPGDRIQDQVIVCDEGHYFSEQAFADATRAYSAGMQQRLAAARRLQADRERGAKTMQHLLGLYGENGRRHAPT